MLWPCTCTRQPCVLAMQIMAVGGNQHARQFFKQHGMDDVGSDKIESKVQQWTAFSTLSPQEAQSHQAPLCPTDHQIMSSHGHMAQLALFSPPRPHCKACCSCPPPLQYTSRAAQLYKAMLEKEAAKLTATMAMAAVAGSA